jgi:hypothetical protein
MTSNSSSTGQGPLTESNTGKSSRPTFTTFGYPEKEHKPYNNEESTVVQNSNSVHQRFVLLFWITKGCKSGP